MNTLPFVAAACVFGGLPLPRFGGAWAGAGAGSSDSVPDNISSESGRGMTSGKKSVAIPSSSLVASSSSMSNSHALLIRIRFLWPPVSMLLVLAVGLPAFLGRAVFLVVWDFWAFFFRWADTDREDAIGDVQSSTTTQLCCHIFVWASTHKD